MPNNFPHQIGVPLRSTPAGLLVRLRFRTMRTTGKTKGIYQVMKKIIIVTVIASFIIPSISIANEGGLPRFYLDYAVVKHSLMSDKGYFDELMELHELDRKSANFIAEFWWNKAKKECNEFVEKIVERYVNKITLQTTEKEKEEIYEKVKSEADQCFYGFYYDNWDAINKMILDKLEAVKKSMKKRE